MDSAEIRKITWLDSNTCNGWHRSDEMNYEPVRAVTVGWLIHEDETSVTLSASVVFGENHQVTDTMTIPKCCIQSDKTLAKR